MLKFWATAFCFFATVAAASAAQCPNIPAAPRTISDSAESYTRSPGFSLNEEGLIQFDYGGSYNGLGKWVNPFFVSNYALALYRDWLNSGCEDEDLLSKFTVQALWLANNATMREGVAIWPYPFENPVFELESGWVSGIGQSRIASVLIRADAILEHNDDLSAIADAAMLAYERPVIHGGVVTNEGNVTWIEEMVDPNGRSFKVLNGHITGLASILDFYQITRDEKWRQLFDRAVLAVDRDIDKYDAGFSSYYSQLMPGNPRPIAPLEDYNPLHVSQLLWLYDLAPMPRFLEYASRFHAYETNSDQFTAKGSIDPVFHGPDDVRAIYGNNYWSHGEFPTWLEISFVGADLIRGVALDFNTERDRPTEVSVSTRLGEVWTEQRKGIVPTTRNLDIIFDSPVEAQAVRIEFAGHSGAGLVAIRAAMALREQPKFAPVVNECNHRPVTPAEAPLRATPDAAFDGNTATAMRLLCDGWIFFPAESARGFTALFDGPTPEGVWAEASDDFAAWEPVEVTVVGDTARGTSDRKYVRLHFPKSNVRLAEIERH